MSTTKQTELDVLKIEDLGNLLEDKKVSLTEKTRVLWKLRAHEKKDKAVKELIRGLISDSALLKHEIAYVMGQIGDFSAIPTLEKLLADKNEDCMVRHEAAESLGAIGKLESIKILTEFLKDENREVRETCELAIKRIEDFNRTECVSGEFQSVDPIPPFKKVYSNDELAKIFLDENETLTQKYRAMFALRNKIQENNDLDALKILCKGFSKKEGALFKHEVAFVLGQLEKEESSDALHEVLMDEEEHPMVRHEAAEALGAICDEKSLKILKEYQKDKVEPVRDSCIVALDMHEYWSKFKK
eukprot:gene8383-208_t